MTQRVHSRIGQIWNTRCTQQRSVSECPLPKFFAVQRVTSRSAPNSGPGTIGRWVPFRWDRTADGGLSSRYEQGHSGESRQMLKAHATKNCLGYAYVPSLLISSYHIISPTFLTNEQGTQWGFMPDRRQAAALLNLAANEE